MNKEEKEINKIIDEVTESILKDVEKYSNKVVNEVDYVRKEVNYILMNYANQDGTIPKHRMNTMFRELDELEIEFSETIIEQLEEQTVSTSKTLNNAVVGGLATVVGLSIAFGSLTNVPEEEDFISDMLSYLKDNKIDNLTIYDRINRLAGLFRDEMQRTIRYGIMSGFSFTKISLEVKKTIDKGMYQVKNIIKTEIPNIIRKGLVTIGGKLKILKAIKIIDNRGRHPYHYHHQCYKYAEQNKYGMGKGVFKPSDTYILNPHPQCTAYFQYIFDESLIEGDDVDVD